MKAHIRSIVLCCLVIATFPASSDYLEWRFLNADGSKSRPQITTNIEMTKNRLTAHHNMVSDTLFGFPLELGLAIITFTSDSHMISVNLNGQHVQTTDLLGQMVSILNQPQQNIQAVNPDLLTANDSVFLSLISMNLLFGNDVNLEEIAASTFELQQNTQAENQVSTMLSNRKKRYKFTVTLTEGGYVLQIQFQTNNEGHNVTENHSANVDTCLANVATATQSSSSEVTLELFILTHEIPVFQAPIPAFQAPTEVVEENLRLYFLILCYIYLKSGCETPQE